MRIVRLFSLVAAIAMILSISAFADTPVITSQPQNVFLPVGTELPINVQFAVMATGDNLTYQWQYSIDGSNWTNANDRDPVYNPMVTDSNVNGKRLYRVIVSNQDGEVSSSIVSVNVGAYLMDTIPQMLVFGSQIIDSIFVWVGSACASIIGTPLLLIGVSFFALGASIAILSRLLSRS